MMADSVIFSVVGFLKPFKKTGLKQKNSMKKWLDLVSFRQA